MSDNSSTRYQAFIDQAYAYPERAYSQAKCAHYQISTGNFSELQSYIDIWYGPTSIFLYLDYFDLYLAFAFQPL